MRRLTFGSLPLCLSFSIPALQSFPSRTTLFLPTFYFCFSLPHVFISYCFFFYFSESSLSSLSFQPYFALYLKPWQCKSLCMCNSILALLTDKAVLFIVGTTCVSCPTALFGWSSLAAHAVLIYGHTLREIHVTAVHEYPHGKSAKAQVQTHTHSQPSCALPNLW